MSPGSTAKISFSGSQKNGTITMSSSPANFACTEKLSQGMASANFRATFGASRSSSRATTRWLPGDDLDGPCHATSTGARAVARVGRS